MSVIRVNKTKDYTVMSNYHFRDKRLSLKAKGLLSEMLSLPEDWNYTISGLAAINKENETAIKTALNELKECGYLKVTKLTSDKTESGRIEYAYDIYERPLEPEKQDLENLGVENLGVENLGVENQPQYNTNNKVLNNKINNNKINNNQENLPTMKNPIMDNATRANAKGESSTRKKVPDSNDAELEAEFESLWMLYPKKIGKKKALKAYKAARKDKQHPVTREMVLKGIQNYVSFIERERWSREYVKNGGNWFNGRAWDDEYLVDDDSGSDEKIVSFIFP